MRDIQFSADGIRGIIDHWPLTSNGAKIIGCALGQFIGQDSGSSVVIGRDTRASGVELVAGIKDGLLSQGVTCKDTGIMTTPGVAFITRTEPDAALGVVVSASRSPVQYNGVKFVGKEGWRLTEEEENSISILIKGACGENLSAPSVASRLEKDIDYTRRYIESQIQYQFEFFKISSPIKSKLVIDCANGATSYVVPQIFKQLDAEVISINTESNGAKINEQCGSEGARLDPMYLFNAVWQHQAAYGLAFDGDGDRLVVVDNAGNIYDGDDILFVLATYFKERGLLRGDTIVTTKMANSGLEECLSLHGIKVRYTRNGDKFLEREICKEDYFLGAEQIGNVIINDGYHAAADSAYAALMLIRILQDTNRDLRQIVAGFRKRPQVRATTNLAGVPEWERNKKPAEVDALLETKELYYRELLGMDARIVAWRSSTERELFNVMVEGGHSTTLEKVEEAAISICRAIQSALGLEQQEPQVFHLSKRQF